MNIDDVLESIDEDDLIEWCKCNLNHNVITGYEDYPSEQLAKFILQICKAHSNIYTKKDLRETLEYFIEMLPIPDGK